MVDLSGHSAEDRQFSSKQESQRNARYGGILFLIYLVVYAIFVGLNTFMPEIMDRVPFAGLNLAIVYGVGLIVFALILALVYSWLCRVSIPHSVEGDSKSVTGKEG